MKFISILALLVSLLAVGLILSHPSGKTSSAPQQTAFDRVIKSGTLRCGYAVATPWFYIDPNTGQKTGVDYDLTMAIAEKTGLKVDWVEETGWGVAEQGLTAGRYDVMCGSVCIDANRTRAATFSEPFLHLPLIAVVRDDDHRFDAGLDTIDKPEVRIGVKNGHVFEYAAKERFPHATRVYTGDISDDTEFFEMLLANKIDIAFTGASTLDLYNEKNAKKLRSLPTPVRYCHGAYMVPLGDYRMKDMLDAAIMQMNTGGQLAQIMSKYVKMDPLYVRLPALPYQ